MTSLLLVVFTYVLLLNRNNFIKYFKFSSIFYFNYIIKLIYYLKIVFILFISFIYQIINNLKLLNLKILKTYIKINLINSFI